MGSGAPVDLALREALDVLHAPDLCPLLHVKQRLPPVSILRSSQIQGSSRMSPAPRRGGPLLDRRRWTSIQAAPTNGPSASRCHRRERIHKLDTLSEWPQQRTDRGVGGIARASLDARYLALGNARERRELALGELALSTTLNQLAGEAELLAELLQLTDGLRTFVLGLELDVLD